MSLSLSLYIYIYIHIISHKYIMMYHIVVFYVIPCRWRSCWPQSQQVHYVTNNSHVIILVLSLSSIVIMINIISLIVPMFMIIIIALQVAILLAAKFALLRAGRCSAGRAVIWLPSIVYSIVLYCMV